MKKIIIIFAFLSILVFINAQSLVLEGEKLQIVSKGYKFLEGPTSDKQGNVYFSDIPNNKIFCCDTNNNVTEYMIVPGCNGLKFDKKGNLWVCGSEKGRSIYYITPKKEVKIIVDKYLDKKFNSPNDLWIAPNGGIYFTDPNYGAKRTDIELQIDGVYYISPKHNTVILIDSTFKKPNGIAGLLNGKVIWVADHKLGRTYQYNIAKNGELKDKTLFCEVGSDGMAIDKKGNIYLTSKGIRVFSPEGKELEKIDVPGNPTNVCFGGIDGKTLFITTPTTLYSIKLNVKGLGR